MSINDGWIVSATDVVGSGILVALKNQSSSLIERAIVYAVSEGETLTSKSIHGVAPGETATEWLRVGEFKVDQVLFLDEPGGRPRHVVEL